MAFLTDRTLATGVTLNDLIHIVITGDTSQNPAGSSYKASIGQVLSNVIFPTDYWTSGSTGVDSIKAVNPTGLDATGDRAVAWGNQTLASGNNSTASGDGSIASGLTSHAEGFQTVAGDYSHTEGYQTQASDYSHAEGVLTIALQGSHADHHMRNVVLQQLVVIAHTPRGIQLLREVIFHTPKVNLQVRLV